MLSNNQVRGITNELYCILDFTKLGIHCLQPVDRSSRYDVVLDYMGRFIKIQCKASRYIRGSKDAIVFNTCGTSMTSRGSVRHFYTAKDIDYFYTSFGGTGYMIPISEAEGKASFCIRFKPPKSSQTKGIHYASNYTIEKFLNTVSAGVVQG